MSLLRQLARGLRALTRQSSADEDLDDEVSHYFDEATAARIADGLSAEEARRAARLELGTMTIAREQVRESGWENVVGTMLADLRYAVRRLRANPGFAAAAIATLAVGIGATTAIFSAVNPILFEPLPYPQAARIMMVSDVGADRAPVDVTFGTYRELLSRSRAFDALAVFKLWQPTVTGSTEAERLNGQRVSGSYFRALGVMPAQGREFEDAEDRTGGPNVVIIGDGLWRRRFAAATAIAGRRVARDDNAYTVVGVMPATFENVLAPS